MDYLVMRNLLRLPLQRERCLQRQIRQRKYQKQLRQQIFSVIPMNIQLQEQVFQQMAGLHQLRQMFQQRLTVNNILIRG